MAAAHKKQAEQERKDEKNAEVRAREKKERAEVGCVRRGWGGQVSFREVVRKVPVLAGQFSFGVDEDRILVRRSTTLTALLFNRGHRPAQVPTVKDSYSWGEQVYTTIEKRCS